MIELVSMPSLSVTLREWCLMTEIRKIASSLEESDTLLIRYYDMSGLLDPQCGHLNTKQVRDLNFGR